MSEAFDGGGFVPNLDGAEGDLLLARRTQKVPIVEGVNGWR